MKYLHLVSRLSGAIPIKKYWNGATMKSGFQGLAENETDCIVDL